MVANTGVTCSAVQLAEGEHLCIASIYALVNVALLTAAEGHLGPRVVENLPCRL